MCDAICLNRAAATPNIFAPIGEEGGFVTDALMPFNPRGVTSIQAHKYNVLTLYKSIIITLFKSLNISYNHKPITANSCRYFQLSGLE